MLRLKLASLILVGSKSKSKYFPKRELTAIHQQQIRKHHRGHEERACCLIRLKTDQTLKNWRSEPNYKELPKKMGGEKLGKRGRISNFAND